MQSGLLPLDVSVVRQIIAYPSHFDTFAQILARMDWSAETLQQLQRITTDQWSDLLELAYNDDSFRDMATNRWRAGTIAGIQLPDAPDTLLDRIRSVLGESGAIVALVIAVVVLLAALTGLLRAALNITQGIRGAELFKAAVQFLGTILTYIGALGGLFAAIRVMISTFYPSHLIRTEGMEIVGGDGGSPFSDDTSAGYPIKKLIIRHGAMIDSIETVWDQPADTATINGKHGGKGGNETTIPFAAGEHIIELRGRSGYRIDQLEIKTNLKQYGPYGGSGGAPFVMTPQYGQRIIGFHGRAGEMIDALGGKTEIYGSHQAGGMGGVPFLDEIPASGRLSRIDIWSGAYVDAMQVTHEIAGAQKVGVKHGGSGGTCKTILIAPGETVTKVYGKHGTYIDSINFVLTKADGTTRTVSGGGGSGGHEDYTFTVPDKKAITGFWGRCGAYIDALGLCTA